MGTKKYQIILAASLMLMTSEGSAWAKEANTQVMIYQQQRITGVVRDQGGEFIPGATVQIKGTTVVTSTDALGQFQLQAKQGDVLRVSNVGFQPVEITVSALTTYDIVLNTEQQVLDEVVLVGYSTQKKVNLSGAVDQVNAQVLDSRPIANVSQGLQGMIPNLNIRFNSGAPGAAADINIRGITSINGGGPLIMIDGVPSSNSELTLLSPQDVETISVIKDASAAAIYGARAAFGVILITTKMGAKAGATVQYSNNFTWNRPTVLGDKVTDPYIFSRLLETSTDNTPWDNVNYSDAHYAYAKERSNNPSLPGARVSAIDPSLWEYMGNQDWARYFLNDFNFANNHDLSISGRSENNKARYYLSGGYSRQNSPVTMADDFFDRYNVRAKLDMDINKWLTVGNNSVLTMTSRKSPTQLSLFNIHNLFPTDMVFNPDGSWANTAAGREAARIVDGGKTDNQLTNLQTQFTATATFWDGKLKLNGDYTHRRSNANYDQFSNKYSIGFGPSDLREEGNNSAYRSATFEYFHLYNLFFSYQQSFGRHALSGLIGYNQEQYRSEWFEINKQGLISSSFPTIGLATGEVTGTESIQKYALQGMFYRLNYIFDDKYIIEFNGRYDGSSRFPKNQRFGFFPSGSVAWRMEQEDFMDPFRRVINNWKWRASYGSLGNQNVSNFGYIASMSTYPMNYLIAGQRPYAISTPGLVSPNYTWEKVNTLNFGVDLGLFNDQFTVVFDHYTRNTLDMLTLGRQLPAVLGASEPRENAADLRTRGWELSLGYRQGFEVASSPLNFNARFVLSDSRSHITRFDNPTGSILQYYEGMELGEIWGLESDGLFKTVEEIAALDQTSIIPWGALQIVPGWPKFMDKDGNGKIEKGLTLDDTKDLRIIGNTTPRYQFGLDVGMDWKNIDFRMFWQGVAKRDYYPIDYLYWGHYQQPYGNTYHHLFDFYRGRDESPEERDRHSQSYLDAGLADANLNPRYPVLQSWLADANLGTRIDQAMGSAIPQTAHLLDASYLRLKNITIGYTLPNHLTRKMGVQKLRVYVSGENVLEFSELSKYFDPETTNSNINVNPASGAGRSGNGMVYPFQRSYSFGLNLIF